MTNSEEKTLITISTADFSKICRTCLNPGHMYPIVGTSVASIQAIELLKYSVDIEFYYTDQLPQHICEDCLNDLFRVRQFKKQCLINDRVLKYLRDNKQITSEEEQHELTNTDQENDLKTQGIEIIETIIVQKTEGEENDSNTENVNDESQDSDSSYVKQEKDRDICTGDILQNHTERLSNMGAEDSHPPSKTKTYYRRRKEPCKICKKIVQHAKMEQHLRTHTKERPYLCDLCPRTFSVLGNLNRHKRAHYGIRPYLCTECGRAFSRVTYLKAHEEAHKQNLDVSRVYSPRQPRTFQYTCEICGCIFKLEKCYKLHVEKHDLGAKHVKKTTAVDTKFSCTVCKRSFASKAALKQHLETHGEKQFFCPHCDMGFVRRMNLKLHLKVHTSDRPYHCVYCPKRFRASASLKAHLPIHTGQRCFECSFCQKKFNQVPHLKNHLRLHTGEKPFVCSFCGKEFAQKTNLTVHTRIHTGETPYMCAICGRGFHDSSSMKRHVRNHNTPAEVDGTVQVVGEQT